MLDHKFARHGHVYGRCDVCGGDAEVHAKVLWDHREQAERALAEQGSQIFALLRDTFPETLVDSTIDSAIRRIRREHVDLRTQLHAAQEELNKMKSSGVIDSCS